MAKRVAVIGSGNWGTVISRIIGRNVPHFDFFHNDVKMYVFQEIVDGKELTEIINSRHENIKYLPGVKVPLNVIAIPSVIDAAEDADILVWVLPHKFVRPTCEPLVGKIKRNAICVSLIKGFDIQTNGEMNLISDILQSTLKIDVSVMMGANIAKEVAEDTFCECTLGCKNPENASILKDLFQTENFRISVVEDVKTVEICGALKNVVAVGAGFVDGLGYQNNTKAAIIRLGLMEMIGFAKLFDPSVRLSTFLESCGVADLITTCYGGRNRKVAQAFVSSGKSIVELEKEMLDGQKLQGPQTAEVVYQMLDEEMKKQFPLFVAVHLICVGEIAPSQFIDLIRYHPHYRDTMPSEESSRFKDLFRNTCS